MAWSTQKSVLEENESPAYRSSPQKQVLVNLLVIICALVFLVHLPALSARATFMDDEQYIFENVLVQNPSWASAKRFFTEVWKPSTVPGYYQPLTMLSLMVDRGFAGTSSMSIFHRTSLLLHAANSALVTILLYLLFGHAWIAAGVGLLFGFHPITVDSICWLSERKTVLATFFALWSLISYVRFTRRDSRSCYIGCLVTYMLALLAKPIALPLPAMMLLMDYWPLNRIGRKAVLEKLPLFVVGGIFVVVIFVSQSSAASVVLPGDYNPAHVPLILCHNIIFYLHKLVWPVNLSAHYEQTTYRMVFAGVIGTGILISLLVISLRWTRGLLTGWLIFFVAILPTMGIVSVTSVIVANRYAYLPSIGLFIVLASFFAWLWTARRGHKSAVRNLAIMATLLMLYGAETLSTRRYLRHWRDTPSLYEHMLTISPRSAALHTDMGAYWAHRDRADEALRYYGRALEIAPDFAMAHFNLAVLLGKSPDKIDEAIQHYCKALENDPSHTEARLNLGSMLVLKGNLSEAVEHFRKAVWMNPNLAQSHYNLGKILTITDHPGEGLEHLREAVHLSPSFVPGLKDLAWFLATHPNPEVRDADEALGLAERASELTKSRNPEILDTLAAAYAARGQFSLASSVGERALAFASRLGDQELASQISERLELYKQQKPYTQDPAEQKNKLVPAVLQSEPGNENLEEWPLWDSAD